jgi:hypothetical protein
MLGEHPRQSQPEGKRTYIAGIDLAGEHEPEMPLRGALATKQSLVDVRLPRFACNDNDGGCDSTVITIAEVDDRPALNAFSAGPVLKVVEQYQWTGTPHSQLYTQMTDILRNVWNCQRIVVDATGIGQPVAGFLRKELGSRVIPFVITSRSKSDMGFELLSFVNSGRLKLYKQDDSREYHETLFELEKAKVRYRPNQTMNFYVDPQEGHDDFLVSLALVVQAAKDLSPREAKGWLRES